MFAGSVVCMSVLVEQMYTSACTYVQASTFYMIITLIFAECILLQMALHGLLFVVQFYL